MNEYHMDRKTKNIQTVVLTIILFVFIIAVYYILYSENSISSAIESYAMSSGKPLQHIIAASSAGLFIIAYVLYNFIFMSYLYKHNTFITDENSIRTKTGAFIKRRKEMKFSSLQYVKKVSLPFSKSIGLNFIVFYGYGNKITFTFLSQNDFAKITETVSQAMRCRGKNQNKDGGNAL